MCRKQSALPKIDNWQYQWAMFSCWLKVYQKYSANIGEKYKNLKTNNLYGREEAMKLTGGIHFTKNNVRIVFMNHRLELLESLSEDNNSAKLRYLIPYLLDKYPPNNTGFILDQTHYNSQSFPKTLLNHGYILNLVPSTTFYDPVFNLLMAVPQKTHFYMSFLNAAMLWIPLWKANLITVKKPKYIGRQLKLFEDNLSGETEAGPAGEQPAQG